MGRVLVTGANGYIGQNLIDALSAEKIPFVKAVKHPQDSLSVKYDLNDSLDDGIFDDVSTVVHCAFQPQIGGNDNSFFVNLEATRKLKDKCTSKNIKFIFLSTISAHRGAISVYGKHKLEIEKKVLDEGDLCLKLGMVVGNGGLFSRLYSTISKSKLVPLVGGGGQPIYTVDINDVCSFIVNSIQLNRVGAYVLCHPNQLSMRDLYKNILEHSGVNGWLVPIPYWLTYLLVFLAEKMNIELPITLENLRGLKSLKSWTVENWWTNINTVPKDFKQSLNDHF